MGRCQERGNVFEKFWKIFTQSKKSSASTHTSFDNHFLFELKNKIFLGFKSINLE